MAAPDSTAVSAMTDLEFIDYLKLEIEHFYRAELYSEQRASWLLTISFGALAVNLNGFVAISQHTVNPATRPYLIVCAVFLFASILCSLGTLWPLRGRRGSLYSPFAVAPAKPVPSQTSRPAELWSDQYVAHRLRAHIKSVRVTWTLVGIGFSVAAGALVLLKNSGAF
jgi:hypothetical protein